MRIGSLFAGIIGGLELGLERAGIGETVWQVELNQYCRAVLAKHWPNAERFEDVRSVGSATLAPVDIICGGFPCQDVSSAGKRVGLAGARSGLWFEYLRIVSEMHPQWVVVENVTSGASAWVDTVLEGLGEQGYACLPIPIAAADVGAPHERRRIFIVATNADENRKHARSEHAEVAIAPEPAANADSRHRQARSGAHRRRIAEPGDSHWRTPVPDVCRVVHGVSARLHGAGNPSLRKQLALPSRRIGALGNAVVPQCAEVIGHVIMELMR